MDWTGCCDGWQHAGDKKSWKVKKYRKSINNIFYIRHFQHEFFRPIRPSKVVYYERHLNKINLGCRTFTSSIHVPTSKTIFLGQKFIRERRRFLQRREPFQIVLIGRNWWNLDLKLIKMADVVSTRVSFRRRNIYIYYFMMYINFKLRFVVFCRSILASSVLSWWP